MKLEDKLNLVKELHGEWSAHNIKLSEDICTMEAGVGERYIARAKVYIQLIRIALKKKVKGLKILDLGCLEGGISIELAKAGAKCTGVDIRNAHLEKAKFASETIKLRRRCKWICDDVSSSKLWESISNYDVIILSGLLYHLDADAIYPLLKRIRSSLKKDALLIVDTNITSKYEKSVKLEDDLTIWGRTWNEHKKEDTLDERISKGWSSLSNDNAFWLTERSLVNILVSAGFEYIWKPLHPFHEWAHKNRDIWLAMPMNDIIEINTLRSDPDNRPTEHPGFNE